LITLLVVVLAVNLFPAAQVKAAGYSTEITESLTLSDSVQVRKYSPHLESLSVGDSVIAHKFTPKSESLSLSDLVSVSVYRSNPKDVSDGLLFSESISARKFTPKSETLNLSDSLSVTVNRSVPGEVSPSPPDEDSGSSGLPVEYFPLWLWTTGDGVLTKAVTFQSNDKNLQLMIKEGTRAKSIGGSPLTYISILLISEPLPSPPEHAHIVSGVYDLGPNAASFDNPVTLTFTYDPARLPEGISEKNLVFAYFDEGQSKWVSLDSIINTVNHTMTVTVTHFTMFTILGFEPGPAVFKVTDLAISPQKVEAGEDVTVRVSVTNTGGKEGTYNLILMVNNAKEAEKSVTVSAGSKRNVTFTISKKDAGTYIVAVDGLSIGFDVTTRPAPPEPSPEPPAVITSTTPPLTLEPSQIPATSINWWLIGSIFAGVIVIGMLTWKLRYFFRRGD